MDDDGRIRSAIDLAIQYGGIDSSHHRAWVIDQMLRILAGDSYDALIKEANAGENGTNTYEWDVGIIP